MCVCMYVCNKKIAKDKKYRVTPKCDTFSVDLTQRWLRISETNYHAKYQDPKKSLQGLRHFQIPQKKKNIHFKCYTVA